MIFSENQLFFVFFSFKSSSWLGKLLNTGLKQAQRPQHWKWPWKKLALFRVAHFVKCGWFLLPLNSWGLFPGSENERKIRRHAFPSFVKRCGIHVIVRKSVMHVHSCCFAPKTFYYYCFFLRCRCFLGGSRVNSLILTWIGGVRWFPHWRGSRVHDVQSLLSSSTTGCQGKWGKGWICLVIRLLPFLCVFLFVHPCSGFSFLFSFSPFIPFSRHFLRFCHGGFILHVLFLFLVF